MNNQLIEKVITSNNEICPPFTYKNPLLDKKVAAALSRSFVKLLSLSKENSNINNSLRLSILENIRRLCQFEPEEHAKVDENFTELLKQFYELQLQDTSTNATYKQLDAFLMRKMKDMDLNASPYESSLNPEIIQALLNLNENGVYLSSLSNSLIHWNTTKYMYDPILKELWSELGASASQEKGRTSVLDDVSIKMRPQIEKVLLETSIKVLDAQTINIPENASIIELVKCCGNSADCFQIACGVLNLLFVLTNFEPMLQEFISSFVKHVKENCPLLTFAALYPHHLSTIVTLLDIDIINLPVFKKEYIEYTSTHINKIQKESENDFVLLLSHFPEWFDVIYPNTNA